MSFFVSEDPITEVFVIGHENPLLICSPCNYGSIVDAGIIVVNRSDVMSLLGQPLRDSRSGTFVDKEAHLCRLKSSGHEACVAGKFSGEEKAGPNIFALKPLVLGEDLVDRGAVGQKVQDEFDRESSSAHDRFTSHDITVLVNSIQELLVSHFPSSNAELARQQNLVRARSCSISIVPSPRFSNVDAMSALVSIAFPSHEGTVHPAPKA